MKWIEKLKGRKDSLNATGVIAVSASGFTGGAINKANRFGIILRSIYNLSEPEIRNWGKDTLVKVIFYEFTDTILTIRSPRTALKLPIALRNEDGTPIQWRSFFDAAMQALDANHDLDIGRVSFDIEIFANVTVCDVKPISMSLHSVSRRIHHEVLLVSVIAYTSPEADPTQYARVAKYELGAFEILQSGGFEEGDEVAAVVDVNPIVPPTNSFFHSVFIDFGRGISAKWFQIIGAGNFDFMNVHTQLQLRMEFV